MLTESVHSEALQAAAKATQEYISKYGEGYFSCGFAWVSVSIKGNTKVGKSFIERGFSKNYGGGYMLWNPSGHHTQDVNAKEEGARAYVSTLKKYLPEIQLYVGSRLD